jgi:hypothetical protein
MQFVKPDKAQLISESDVEQHFVYPFLIADLPSGLGLTGATIVAKHNIRRFVIDKGEHQKSYFPDYLAVVGGFPLLVV